MISTQKFYKSTDSSKENLVSGIIQKFLTLKPRIL